MNLELKTVNQVRKINLKLIPEDHRWSGGPDSEMKIHRIHAYPAKFPALIATQAFKEIKNGDKNTEVADVFCGCGTVAFEAKRSGINFWGCDINPVATLIAKVKSQKYDSEKLKEYFQLISENYLKMKISKNSYAIANERLRYWFTKKQYENLKKLKLAIEKSTPQNTKYRLFFMCGFSNILKGTSRWLTKSIKPQIDPHKKKQNVSDAFVKQCDFMMKANSQIDVNDFSKTTIVNSNFLKLRKKIKKVDMIITSPPYATSYEYADLHQLSSLWLDFVDDYRQLRKGSIGSRYHLHLKKDQVEKLNITGLEVVNKLLKKDKEKAKSVIKYFVDMQSVAQSCRSILKRNGKALFVIGNTRFKGVYIDNARHLSESLIRSGFKKVTLNKRKIVRKNLTPYRDNIGKFTTNKKSRKIYAEEYILIGFN